MSFPGYLQLLVTMAWQDQAITISNPLIECNRKRLGIEVQSGNCIELLNSYFITLRKKFDLTEGGNFEMPEMELSVEELAQNDGKDGRPVYIAYEGKIYDVSQSKLWKTGSHMKRHPSGKDLTTDIGGAPHGPEVLDRYPHVGVIRRETLHEIEEKTFLEPLFKKVPFLRRHPHPMTVHFPIVFMLSAAFFTLLYLLTDNPSFDATAFYCLAGGVIFTPIVILTGFISWSVNYLARPTRRIKIKIAVSLLMLVVSLVALVWRELTPDILTRFGVAGSIYSFLVFSLCPMVSVIGWHGANLTFPIEKE
jgi:predicted heme/steroid binding protein/uncharacterized membrane protein